ncbi:MAG: hexokinase [Sphaerochaetaceae bacterium]
MDEVVSRTRRFLKKWGVGPECVDMHELLDAFKTEMGMGLAGKGGSLAMIPTYVEVQDSVPVGENVIVLDAGGTNFRTCLVTFGTDGKPVISDFKKTAMPGLTREVSAKEFFGAFADEVERLIDKSDRIGFCFSYAASITPEHDGIPIMFSKEIKAPEVIGKPVGKNLLDELARRGHDVSRKKVAVLNDTVATLLAGQSFEAGKSFGGYIGFILGTGTNVAYVENNRNVVKLPSLKPGKQIINVESGNFSGRPGKLDELFFSTTKQPDIYHFEKMISGAYLGPQCQLCIEKAIEAGVLSQTFAERFATVKPLSTTVMSNYLEMPFNKNYDLVKCVDGNENDAIALWYIIDAIIGKAAKLTAANLASAVLACGSGTDPRRPVCINADGTTFYKTEFLRRDTEYYLQQYLERELGRYAVLVKIEDSPTIGAAIAGLSV